MMISIGRQQQQQLSKQGKGTCGTKKPPGGYLCWQSRMSVCQNKGQNNRHVSVRPACHRHVGRHVGDTTQKAVGRGTGPTCHSMSLADMSAICRQHDKYLAVGFEPLSMLLFLDSPATLPVRTCVLIYRVAGISSNMSAA
jgi:hypothetical protein